MATATYYFSPVKKEDRVSLDFRSGDTVRVWSKIQEGGKTRLQAFEGVVLARKHGTEPGATFTVRRVASGVGTERIFPLFSPSIDRIELVKRAKTRRAKLFYIREKAAKEIRKKLRVLEHLIPGQARTDVVKPEGDDPQRATNDEQQTTDDTTEMTSDEETQDSNKTQSTDEEESEAQQNTGEQNTNEKEDKTTQETESKEGSSEEDKKE